MPSWARDIARPALRPDWVPRALSAALGADAFPAVRPTALHQVDDETWERGAEKVAHFPARCPFQGATDKVLDFTAFDVGRVRVRTEGASD